MAAPKRCGARQQEHTRMSREEGEREEVAVVVEKKTPHQHQHPAKNERTDKKI